METNILYRIIEIIEETPNDMELGSKLRELYWNFEENIKEKNEEKRRNRTDKKRIK